jgi:dynein heavy chain
MPVMANPLN